MKKSLIPITETAVLVALAFVLELLSHTIPLFSKPQGGSVTLAFIPIIVVGFRRGVLYGILAAMSFTILQLIFFPEIYHWGSVFLDYFFAFGVIGLTGLFAKKRDNIWVYGGAIVLCFVLKFGFHWLSGVVLFREYAIKQGYVNELAIWLYSFIYNLDYNFFSMLVTLAVGLLIHRVVTNPNTFYDQSR